MSTDAKTSKSNSSGTGNHFFDESYKQGNLNFDVENATNKETGKGKGPARYRTTIEDVDDDGDDRESISVDPRAFEYPQFSYSRFENYNPTQRQSSVATDASDASEILREMSSDINSDLDSN